MVLLQGSGSLQGITGDSPLLPIWGSQEHTSCQLLLSPRDVQHSSLGTSEIAAQQPGCCDRPTVGQQNQQGAAVDIAAINAARNHIHVESDYAQTQLHQQQRTAAGSNDDGGFQEMLQQLQWQLQQQQQQPQQQDMQNMPQQHAQQHAQVNNQHCHKQHCQGWSSLMQLPLPCKPPQQPGQQGNARHWQLSCVPALDLSRVKIGSSQAVKVAPEEDETLSSVAAARDAELCLDAESIRDYQLHPNAPLQDNRCYIYRAAGRKELADVEDMLERLPPHERSAVSALWDALLVARHDCELMAARGVRVSRDISRDWQETVSDLIDRVVAQDQELAQIKQQLKAAQATAAAATTAVTPRTTATLAGISPDAASATMAGTEELHAQIIRLKRQRDRLARDQQELVRTLAETQEAAQLARQEATETRAQLDSFQMQAQDLQQHHASLQQQNSDLAAAAECLAARVQLLEAAIASGAAGSRLSCLPLAGMGLRAMVGDRTSSIGSEGGADQPKPDQTTNVLRPRSPTVTKTSVKNGGGRLPAFVEAPAPEHLSNSRLNSGCYKAHSRSKTPAGLSLRSPTSHSICTYASYRSSPRTSVTLASKVADDHEVRALKVAATSSSTAYHAALSQKLELGTGGSSSDGSAGFQHHDSQAGCKALGHVCWGSAGGASQSVSCGGGAQGSAGLSSSSNPQLHFVSTAKCSSIDMPRSSDDVSMLDTSRASHSHIGYVVLRAVKEVDQLS